MTTSYAGGVINLTGACGVEEVEGLLGLLEIHPGAQVDIQAATAIHTALWQTIMVFRPQIIGSPGSPSIEAILPALRTYLDKTHEA